MLQLKEIKSILDYKDIPIATTFKSNDGVRIDYYIGKIGTTTDPNGEHPYNPDWQIFTDFK
jgi:hypothetical protein